MTNNKLWDVRWPSSDNDGRIVYELNGELQVLDTKSRKSTAISITVPDDGLARRPSRVSAAGQIESVGLSPKGERAVFAARGDIFSAPIEKGPTRNLTHSSGAHDKWPSWSPDGSRIAFISDMSGEEELYRDSAGRIESAGTNHARRQRHALSAGVGSGRQTNRFRRQRRQDPRGHTRRSQDDRNRRLTTRPDPRLQSGRRAETIWRSAWRVSGNGFSSVYIWNAADGKVSRVTDDMFNAYNPAWDPQGNYLYFLSDREFAPQISQIEFNYATNRDAYIYALAPAERCEASLPAGER